MLKCEAHATPREPLGENNMPRTYVSMTILILVLLVSACGGSLTPEPAPQASNTPMPTYTPDPCSPENLSGEIIKVHRLTRAFDDYSILASNTTQTQLIQIIPDMQAVFREAQDQTVPECLQKLKQLQLTHMNIVVQTLIAFMSANDQAGVEMVNAGITQARDLRAQYDIEMTRLTGMTPTAMYILTAPESTSVPTAAP
jgi:hypothetical protein